MSEWMIKAVHDSYCQLSYKLHLGKIIYRKMLNVLLFDSPKIGRGQKQ